MITKMLDLACTQRSAVVGVAAEDLTIEYQLSATVAFFGWTFKPTVCEPLLVF
jgi:hypothetical protein